jgi:hypothetical protein
MHPGRERRAEKSAAISLEGKWPKSSIRVSPIYQGIFGDCPDRHSLRLSAKLDFSLLKR